MEHPKPNAKNKRPYEKPFVVVINLVAPEVLSSGCKLPTGGTAVGASPCPAGGCSGPGS